MTYNNRREFIKSASLVFGSIILFPSCLKNKSNYRFFTSEEALCIIAICEQIIPKDGSPGATDAGVIYYIDRQLSSVFYYDQEIYRNGIRLLQEYSVKKYKNPIQKLAQEEQVEVLKALESNSLTNNEWPKGNSSDFFNRIVNHTMQGFYGSPIHGGNKDFMSFEMLRIDYPLVIGQNRYRSNI